jgi:integrase
VNGAPFLCDGARVSCSQNDRSSDSTDRHGQSYMGNPHLKLVAPATVNRTLTPKRAKNSELRSREYLTPDEVEALIAAVRQNRQGHRDATMLLVAFRHGLRSSELVGLRWEQGVDRLAPACPVLAPVRNKAPAQRV